MNYSYRHKLSNELLSYIDIYRRPHVTSPSIDHLLRDYEYRQAPCCVLSSNIGIPLSLGQLFSQNDIPIIS